MKGKTEKKKQCQNISTRIPPLRLPVIADISVCLFISLSVRLKLFFLSFYPFLSFLTLPSEAWRATRWKDSPQVEFYLFIESEGAEDARASRVYEIALMEGQ